jgi:hypothetical protein
VSLPPSLRKTNICLRQLMPTRQNTMFNDSAMLLPVRSFDLSIFNSP